MKKQKFSEPKINASVVQCHGIVTEALANALFRVKLANDVVILCTICGKIRKGNIQIIPGDKVDVGVNIYDTTKGRILYRHKN